MLNWLYSKIKGDIQIWLIIFILTAFSIMEVYSSTSSLAFRHAGNTEYYLYKYLGVIFFSVFLMYFAHKINYIYYSGLSVILLYLSIPLLLLTVFLAKDVHGAKRWLELPVIHLTIQTSDIAKLALVMYIARVLSKNQDKLKDFKSTFRPIAIAIIVICCLIAPSNLSTALILFISSILLMIIGRLYFKHILALTGVLIVAATLFILVAPRLGFPDRTQTWINRATSVFYADKNNDDENNYQITQAKIAIARGGIFGKLPGNSIQKNSLPYAYSDFIYCIIIEEWGMLGGIFILILYLWLLQRTIRIVIKAPKAFGALLAIGISIMIVLQAIVHMMINCGLGPVTGIPLPFVSMGGSSLVFMSISIGIILSVSRNIEEIEKTDKIPVAE